VDFAAPSTANAPDSGPTVASRTVMIVGGILEKAARKARARLDELGGELRERVSIEETYDTPPGLFWNDETYSGDAYPVYGWACDIAEVEVDLDTFETNVVGFWSATDVGRAINPVMCKGQIEGGTLQAIGWALFERVVWKDGRILNGRMTNYIVPTALDAPAFETTLVEKPYSRGPGGGAKGIGELPMDGGAPALAAAIENATGLVLDDLPLLPEDLFAVSQLRRGPTSAAPEPPGSQLRRGPTSAAPEPPGSLA
jgi:CO/xanthine dehydrogenase Mo-binding subunit